MFGAKDQRVREIAETFYAGRGTADVDAAVSLLRQRLKVPIDEHIHLFYVFTMALLKSIEGSTPVAPMVIDFIERLDARLRTTEPSAPAMLQYRQASDGLIRQFLAASHEGLNIAAGNIRTVRGDARARSLGITPWEAMRQLEPDSLRGLQDMPVNARRLAACTQAEDLRAALDALGERCQDIDADAKRR
jgi:hypothetical protein